MMDKEIGGRHGLRELAHDVGGLCKLLFKIDGEPVKLAPFQEELVRAMLWKTHPRIILWCVSQIGKSSSLALGLILTALFYPNEKIVNVSATNRQAGVIFQYVREHLFDHPFITDRLSVYSREPREMLLKKLNREEIRFTTNSYISLLSAEAGVPAGDGLLGHTATTLCIDESPSIKDVIYRTRILRMLGSKREGVRKTLVELGTCYDRGHFLNSWNDPGYQKIFVDWRRAVAEDRMDQSFVDQQRNVLTAAEFSIWYDCVLPDASLNQFVPHTWIKRAVEKEGRFAGSANLGVDVATGGKDLAVLAPVYSSGSVFSVAPFVKIETCSTTELAGEVMQLDKKIGFNRFNIDCIGVGEGVVDVLKGDRDFTERVNCVKFSHKPTPPPQLRRRFKQFQEKSRFTNMKAEMYQHLHKLFEDDRISIPEDPRLMEQLASTRFTYPSGKTAVVYDGSGSADELDALVLGVWEASGTTQAPLYWKPLSA